MGPERGHQGAQGKGRGLGRATEGRLPLGSCDSGFSRYCRGRGMKRDQYHFASRRADLGCGDLGDSAVLGARLRAECPAGLPGSVSTAALREAWRRSPHGQRGSDPEGEVTCPGPQSWSVAFGRWPSPTRTCRTSCLLDKRLRQGLC